MFKTYSVDYDCKMQIMAELCYFTLGLLRR